MTRKPYEPTHADRVTGLRVAKLRRTMGETLKQTVEGAGLDLDPSTLSRVENGKRRLTDPEAAKLAAHFETSVAEVVVRDPDAPALLAALPASKPEDAPTLGVVVDSAPRLPLPAPGVTSTLTIDLDNPMHPDDYRLTVWLPYLEARYNEDERKTA